MGASTVPRARPSIPDFTQMGDDPTRRPRQECSWVPSDSARLQNSPARHNPAHEPNALMGAFEVISLAVRLHIRWGPITNKRAIRVDRYLPVALLLAFVHSTISAQRLPIAPANPHSRQECQAFSREIDGYAADYARQHEECLASHESDHPDEPADSPICSRSVCQYLHDILHGHFFLSVNALRDEVSACYDEVTAYEKKQAELQKERVEEEGAENDLSQKDADDSGDPPRSPVISPHVAPSRPEPRSFPHTPQDPLLTTDPPPISQDEAGPGSGLVDPFGQETSKSPNAFIAVPHDLPDPFPSSSYLVDPFSSSSTPDEEAWDGAKGILEGFVGKAADNLAATLSSARKTMSPAEFREFSQAVGNAKSYLDGFNKTVAAAEFAADARKIIANPHDPGSYHDIIADGASHGTSYILRKLSPDFISKLWEGPPGWFAAYHFRLFDDPDAEAGFRSYDGPQ